MSHYILIHGAWEESRMWKYVSPILEQNGHKVTAIDLPGHGENKQPILQVTMARYIEFVVDAIKRLDHKVILVGHSMTGTVISQVAELIPEKVEKLVYVAAFLLKEGGSVLEAMQSDGDGKFFPEVIFSEDQTYAMVSEQTLRRVGFHDVDENIIQSVLPLMAERQATEPFMAKVVVSAKNFGSVPKVYIRTSLDQVTSPVLQDTMIANWDVEAVLDLESGHFPAFSAPEKLAELMLQSASIGRERLVSSV
jgi:pimeloyl-ACP methyl ester carboxylesterase